MLEPKIGGRAAQVTRVSHLLLLSSFAVVGYMAVCLLKHGIDLPYADDWNVYLQGTAGEVGLKVLFTRGGDTLHPAGRLLDALAFRWLSGNSVAYQCLSLVAVLGSLLSLQWSLLRRVFDDPWMLGGTFSVTLLMLQPDSYWGLQDGAYHQALPLICILGALVLALQTRPIRFQRCALVFLAAVAGLSYISGAFSTLSLAVVLGACAIARGSPYVGLKKSAATLLIGALTTSLVQGTMIFSRYGLADPGHALAWPMHAPFWSFFLGVVGRSLMLNVKHLAAAWAVPCVALAVAIVLVVYLSQKLLRGALEDERDSRGAVVFLTLSAAMLAYLGLVSSGRAQRYAWFVEPNQILEYSHSRFHYYWMTVFWPWLVAALLIALKHVEPHRSLRLRRGIACLVMFAVVGWTAGRGVFRHDKAFKRTAQLRQKGLACLVQGVQHPEPFSCLDVFPMPVDMHRAYATAHARNASFTRLLPMLPLRLDDPTPTPVFDLGNSTQKASVQDSKGRVLLERGSGLTLSREHHPAVQFRVEAPKDLKECETVEITALVRGVGRDVASLYCTTPEQPGFGSGCHYTYPTQGGGQSTELSFLISNPAGFHGDFRLDLVREAERIDIDSLKVRCRRNAGAT